MQVHPTYFQTDTDLSISTDYFRQRRAFAALMLLQLPVLHGCGKKDGDSSATNSIDWGSIFLQAFETLGADIASVRAKTSGYTSVSQWRTVSIADVSIAGGGACAIPLTGVVAIPVEFGYLLQQIYNSALGIGFIVNGDANKDDFANILAIWCDEYALTKVLLTQAFAASGAAYASFGVKVGEIASDKVADRALGMMGGAALPASPPAIAQIQKAAKEVPHTIISNVLAHHSGNKVAGKLGAKLAAKLGAKFGAKMGAKLSTVIIPGVSAIVCGGVNWWIMDGVLTSAEQYFSTLSDFRKSYQVPLRK